MEMGLFKRISAKSRETLDDILGSMPNNFFKGTIAAIIFASGLYLGGCATDGNKPTQSSSITSIASREFLPEPDYIIGKLSSRKLNFEVLKNTLNATGGKNIGGVDIYQGLKPIPLVSPIPGKVTLSESNWGDGNLIITEAGIFGVGMAHFDEIFVPKLDVMKQAKRALSGGYTINQRVIIGTQGSSGANSSNQIHTHITFFGNKWFHDYAENRFKDWFSVSNYLLDPDKHANGKPFMHNYWDGKENADYENGVKLIRQKIASLRNSYDGKEIDKGIGIGELLRKNSGYMLPMRINDLADFMDNYRKKFSNENEFQDDPLAKRLIEIKSLVIETGKKVIFYSIFINQKDKDMVEKYKEWNPEWKPLIERFYPVVSK